MPNSSLFRRDKFDIIRVCVAKKTDFISRFEFSFLCFLAFSVPFSTHALRDFKEEISDTLRCFCILFRFRELYFLRDR